MKSYPILPTCKGEKLNGFYIKISLITIWMLAASVYRAKAQPPVFYGSYGPAINVSVGLTNTTLDVLGAGTNTTVYPVDTIWHYTDPNHNTDPCSTSFPFSGPVILIGGHVHLQLASPITYLANFPDSTTLLSLPLSLKIYLPTDTLPKYTNDSLQVEMSTATPQTGYDLDLTTLMQSAASSGKFNPGTPLRYTLQINTSGKLPHFLYPGVNIKNFSVSLSSSYGVVITPKVKSCLTTVGTTLDNPVIFSWRDCCPVNNYQIQVLRLYNVDSSLSTNDHIKALVDWSQALTVETNTGTPSIKLTMAEGTGYYVWRVRRIYDQYPNGSGDNRNWGDWTYTGPFITDDTVEVQTSMINSYLFYYNEFSDTLNWIYNRQFVEGEINHGSQIRIGEKTTFANFLLMPIQSQVKSQTDNVILGSQIIPDNIGRPVFQTLSAPLKKYGFGYQYNYITNTSGNLYTPADYDQDNNFGNPSKVGNSSMLTQYYSDLDADIQIPNAEGYPYNRTLYENDGTNREKEIASVGLYHTMNSGHTIRKYYGKATTTELISLFGNEAPKAESVLKTITADPNNTLSVSYTDENGHVLATGLTLPYSPLLDPLGYDSLQVKDTLSNRVPVTPTRLLEKGTYAFATPTKLSYFYNIVPNIYGDTCMGLCATCDYKVTITAQNVDDDTLSHQYRDTIIIAPVIDSTGGACTATGYTIQGDYSINGVTQLPQGTYNVSLFLDLNNQNSAGQQYIDQSVGILHRKVLDELNNSTSAYVPGRSAHLSMAQIRSYLTSNDMGGLLSYVNADLTLPSYTLVVGCDTITLPTDHCEAPDCANPKFAEYMVNYLLEYDTINNVITYSNISDISQTIQTGYTDLFRMDNNAELNSVIENMINDGYNCDTLWDAWQLTVSSYASSQAAAVTPGTAMNSSTQKVDWWHDFMRRVNYKFPLVREDASTLSNPSSLVRTKPYHYYPYTVGTNMQSENNFCYMYMQTHGIPIPNPFVCNSGSSIIPGSPGVWYDSLKNFPTYDLSYSYHMYNFMKSLIDPNSFFTNLFSTNSNSNNISNPSQITAQQQQQCYQACESRLPTLVSELAENCMQQTYYVQGYTYPFWQVPATDSVPLTGIYCMANAIVSACKQGCVTTSSGTYNQAQVDSMQQSSIYDIQVDAHPFTTSPTCAPGYQLAQVGADSLINEADDLVDWLNYRYNTIYDSLGSAGTILPYSWPLFQDAGSLGQDEASACISTTVDVAPADARGFFTLGTLLGVGSKCGGSTLSYYRVNPGSTIYNDLVTVEVDAILSFDMPATDSVVFQEDVLNHNIISSMGSNNGTTMRYSVSGFLAAGDTIKFTYLMRAPNTPTTLSFSGTITQYTAGVAHSCTVLGSNMKVAQCTGVYYHHTGHSGSWEQDSVCNICYKQPSCSGAACFQYVAPGTNPPGVTPDTVLPISCNELVSANVLSSLSSQISLLTARHDAKLRAAYATQCLNADAIHDLFVNKFTIYQPLYTLYYYDRAGNLVRTVAPEGVHDTATSRYTLPGHQFVNEYDYNTLGQTLRQETPDGGNTYYWYDSKGRVRLSQDAQQSLDQTYAYTRYDALSRVIETGLMAHAGTIVADSLDQWAYPTQGAAGKQLTFITSTIYTVPFHATMPGYSSVVDNSADFIANRVSYTVTDRDGNFNTGTDQVTTIYRYDPHGNVTSQIQHTTTAPYATVINYQYDLISNKVTQITQQRLINTPSNPADYQYNDYLAQTYAYDADKRLTKVSTTYLPNGAPLMPQATYTYYEHGPLRRIVYGQNSLQGEDFTYTIEGWLKGINYHIHLTQYDPGHDSANGVQKDLFGMSIGYYAGDFNRENSPFNSIGNHLVLNGGDLFNGNISSVMWYRPTLNYGLSQPVYAFGPNGTGNNTPPSYIYDTKGFTYRYDQLNRITGATYYVFDSSNWHRPADNTFDESFAYDKNGNLTALSRNGQYTNHLSPPGNPVWTTTNLDNLSYTYMGNNNGDPTNRMSSIADRSGPHTDADDMGYLTDYGYDSSGHIISEYDANDTHDLFRYSWTPYGKIDTLGMYDVSGSLKYSMKYYYDANGNRVDETYKYNTSNPPTDNYYVYSADNHMLAHYQSLNGTNTFTIKERYLYGSDMLGKMAGPNAGATYTGNGNIIGPVWPIFDMKDQLGNNRIGFSYFSTGVQANISNDYYAFGWNLSQKFGGPTFGFNGQRIDDSKSGLGELYNYGAREYDPRISRFMSIDPLYENFVNESPYLFGGDNPIFYGDMEGNKKTVYYIYKNAQTNTYLKLTISSPGLKYRTYTSYFSDITTYDWYDYSVTNTFYVDKSGKVTINRSAPVLTTFRTNTILKSEWYAKEKIGENQVKDSRTFNGFIGYSEEGGGEGNRFEPNAGPKSKYLDYGRLLRTIGYLNGFNHEGPEGFINLIEGLNSSIDLGNEMATDEGKTGAINADMKRPPKTLDDSYTRHYNSWYEWKAKADSEDEATTRRHEKLSNSNNNNNNGTKETTNPYNQ